MIKEVSPFGFFVFGSVFCFDIFRGLCANFPLATIAFDVELSFMLLFRLPVLGPLSLRYLTNLAAYSLLKTSQMPSHATTIKS